MDIVSHLWTLCLVTLLFRSILAAVIPAHEVNEHHEPRQVPTSADDQCHNLQLFFNVLKLEDGSRTSAVEIDRALEAAAVKSTFENDPLSPTACNVLDIAASPQWAASVSSPKQLGTGDLRAIAIVRAAAIMARHHCCGSKRETITPRAVNPAECNKVVGQMINTCKRNVKDEVSSCKDKERKAIADCKNVARGRVAQCKSQVRAKVAACKDKVRGEVARCKNRVQGKIDVCKKDVQNEVDTCKNNVQTAIANCKNHYKDEINKCKKKLGPFCEVGRIFPAGACEPQRLKLPTCELNRAKLQACELRRPALMAECEPRRIKIPGCELNRPTGVLQRNCELQRPQFLARCEGDRKKQYQCSLDKATICCEVPRVTAKATCFQRPEITKLREEVTSQQRECQAKLFGGGKRETFLRKSEEGGTEHDKCVPSASLMPQDYQEFNYLDSLEEVDTALAAYEELIQNASC
ncbi:hypothetical protein N7505_007889 [Penicillium chrysogenum]|uniref:Uncharacterized protein n=1 Tax=Penicillium chrysogenum TaxID=5076 RepID=A0ABQ8WES8_PENCH|nr:hypothetical protein N7505_007889 [Penicillium chrysogenum]